jgi:hypothetical protein
MDPFERNPRNILNALKTGGVPELRDACDLADEIVDAVLRAGDEETLSKGFQAFRARKDYIEDSTSQPGSIHFHPLSDENMTAPP